MIVALLVSLLAGGCGSGTDATTLRHRGHSDEPLAPAAQHERPAPVDIAAAQREVAQLECPEGVDAELWDKITGEFIRQLEIASTNGSRDFSRGFMNNGVKAPSTRKISSAPISLLSQAQLSLDVESATWGYYSQGDYDQNSEVNTADLVPLAIHFHKSALPNRFLPGTIEAVVDGDANGEINLADITPIVLNYRNTVTEYLLFASESATDYPDPPDGPNGTGAQLIADPDFTEATGNPQDARLQFSSPLSSQHGGMYFWARPTDGTEEGIASTLAGPYAPPVRELSGYVYLAGPGTDPLPGATVELSGDLSFSTTTDDTGRYSFEVPNGSYTVAPTGDPYGYTPVSRFAAIDGSDMQLDEFRQAPVDIVHTWGLEGGLTDQISDIALDIEMNVYVSVISYDLAQQTSFSVLKYNMFGELLWSRQFDAGLERGFHVAVLVDDSGSVYVGGDLDLPAFEPTRPFLMKLDSQGEILWSRYQGGMITGRFDEMVFDGAGNICLFAGNSNRILALRITPQGEFVQERYYDTVDPENTSWKNHKMQKVVSGGIVISGQVGIKDILKGGYYVSKLSSSGELLWLTHWNPPWLNGHNGIDSNVGLSLDKQGNIYLCGLQTVYDGIGEPCVSPMFCFNSQGDLLWQRLIRSPQGCATYDIKVDPYGYIASCGQFGADGQVNPDTDPLYWSFYNNGSLRYSEKWEVQGDGDGGAFHQMEITPFGVAILTGTSTAIEGVWTEQEVEVTDPEIVPSSPEGISHWELEDDLTSQDIETGVADELLDSSDGSKQAIIIWHRP